MPTYEFRCPNGHSFDEFHKISDAPQAATCPACGAEAVRAISGGAGLVFKGSGFYLTDYGKNAHRTSGPAAAGGEKSSDSTSDGGSSGGEKADKPASAPAASAAASSGSSSKSGGGSTGGSSTGGRSTGGSPAGGTSSGGATA